MYDIYLPNQPTEGLRSQCAVMLIQHWHQCDVNLGQQQDSEFSLGCDVVMKLFMDISRKYHHVYCDVFTSVPLLKDLLVCKKYCNETRHVNRKHLPCDICKPSRMIWVALQTIPGWQLKLGGHCLARQ